MADLSPAAQSVLEAVESAMEGGFIEPDFVPYEARKIVAALRATALYCTRERLILMAIADELEGVNEA
jgi:uncharacterized membrane protein